MAAVPGRSTFHFPVIITDVRWFQFPGIQRLTYEKLINCFSPYALSLLPCLRLGQIFFFFSILGTVRFGGFLSLYGQLSFCLVACFPERLLSLVPISLFCCNPARRRAFRFRSLFRVAVSESRMSIFNTYRSQLSAYHPRSRFVPLQRVGNSYPGLCLLSEQYERALGWTTIYSVRFQDLVVPRKNLLHCTVHSTCADAVWAR